MSRSLMEKYTYGHTRPLTALSPEGDFFYGIPKRQKELVALTKKQIDMQQAAAQHIAASNIEAADMIVREIDRQTRSLEGALGRVGDQISAAIEILGDRVCAELSEIRWELAQQRAISEQMLAVLKRPRSTEAQELIRQGLRNLINAKYPEAEDRFRRAMDLDNTDYQVLVNLSYIALHNDKAQEAINFLNDALTLPEDLDKKATADAFWSLARVYYAIEQYEQCYSYAHKSLKALEDPRRIFQTGVYAVLCGRKDEAVHLLEDAIKKEHTIFALASAEPELDTIRSNVLSLLSRLSLEALNASQQCLAQLEMAIKSVNQGKELSQYNDLVVKVHDRHTEIKKVLGQPSYSECIKGTQNIRTLQASVPFLSQLDSKYAEKKSYEVKRSEQNKCTDELTRKYNDIEENASSLRKLADSPASFFGLIAVYFILGAIWLDARPGSPSANYGGPIGFILWPLILCWDILYTLMTSTQTLSWFWGFIFKAACVIGAILFVKNYFHSSSQNRMDKTRRALSQSQTELNSLDMALQNVVKQISTLRGDFDNKMRQLV
jgi:tetratricopeptide (TPR) repeat protein